MTPLTNAEVNKLMQEVATLMADVKNLKEWRREVDDHDEAQDKALAAVESDVRDINTNLKNLRSLLKWILGFAVAIFLAVLPSAIDTIAWNLVHKFSEK